MMHSYFQDAVTNIEYGREKIKTARLKKLVKTGILSPRLIHARSRL
jgi:hypothetical protein